MALAHYMLGASVVAVALAGAGALGLFDKNEPTATSTTGGAEVSAVSEGMSQAAGARPVLTVTYVLVSSEEERTVWDNVEETINQRELLSTLAIEVFVVTNAKQEAAAYEAIESARERYPWNEHVVQDLRAQ